MVIPSILTSLSQEKMKFTDRNTVAGDHPRKQKSRRSFSRILKAVLFETALARKVRKRKARKKSLCDQQQKINKNTSTELDIKNSRRIVSSSSTLCSPSNSMSSSEKRSNQGNSTEPDQVRGSNLGRRVGEFYRSNPGLFLLLLSLLVLIFCGRVGSVFCISTWLFFAPSRINCVDSPETSLTLRSIG